MKLTRDTKMRIVDDGEILCEIDAYPPVRQRRAWWRWLPDWVIDKPYQDEDNGLPHDLSVYPVATVVRLPEKPREMTLNQGIKVGDRVLIDRHFICRSEWGGKIVRFVKPTNIIAVLEPGPCLVSMPKDRESQQAQEEGL